jgi:type I restriction enzyme S subunit
MKQGWEIKKIGDVCKVIAGQSPEGKYYNDNGNGLPFYQGKKEYGEKYIGEPRTWTTKVTKEAEVNDILMSVRAPVGPINFATQKICIGRGLAAIRASKFIDKEFLFNFLLKHENEIVGNTGAVFNSINKAQIEAIKIPLPSLPEQQRIVAILNEAFVAIAKAKANAEQNLKNSKELFESYLQNVFETKGEGWEEKTLGDVAEQLFAGGDVPKGNSSKFKTDKFNIPIFSNGEKNKGLYGYTNVSRVTKPSITISARGTIGYSEIRKNAFYPAIRLIVITPKIDIIDLAYLKYIISGIDFKHSGSSIPQLTVPMIKEYPISFPSLKEQQAIVEKLDAISLETKRLEAIYQQKINDLEELKKSVLQKAFAGELKEKLVTV